MLFSQKTPYLPSRENKPHPLVSYPITSALLKPGHYFHLQQRSTDEVPELFRAPEDYAYFLKNLAQLSDCLQVVAYALLPDHYHLIVRFRSLPSILKIWEAEDKPLSRSILRSLPVAPPARKDVGVDYLHTLPRHVQEIAVGYYLSRRFGVVLNQYSSYVGRKYEEFGTVFKRPFRRRQLEPDVLPALVVYLHRNSRHHRVEYEYERYPHSSYRSFLSEAPTALDRAFVLGLFGGQEAFKEQHQRYAPDRDRWGRFAVE